jgi:hypothetical protein
MSQKMAGIKKIKTAQKTKLRSKPKVDGQEYLELYLMIKERDRLNRYNEVISETKQTTGEEIEELEQEFRKMQNKAGIINPDALYDPKLKTSDSQSQKLKKRKPSKPMKTMTINY